MATQTSVSTVQSLYVAYYGRPADPAGLSYWAQRLEDNGGDTTAIIKAFGDSAEYVDRFSGFNSATLVNNLYQQLFGRDAEDTGRDFYVNMLESGEKSLAEIALTISNAAQGSDSTVFAGRVEVADAFTEQLDTAEEIAAYSTERGIGIGKNYLEEVTVTNTATKVLSKTIETVATLLPTTPGDGGTGGGGGGGTPAPTFTLAVDGSDVLTFGGTATGEISVSAGTTSGEYNFTRGGVTATLTRVESQGVQSVDVGAADIRVPGSEVSLLILGIKGSGNLTITDVATDVKLAGLSVDKGLNVTLEVTGTQDITDLDSGWIDNLDLAAGAVVTMTVDQFDAISSLSGEGSYALKDTADNLAPDTGTVEVDAAVANGVDITVTDAVSLAQLQALNTANGGGALTYTIVSGTAAELQADVATNGGAGTYVTDGKDVLVTDQISVTELDDLVGTIGNGDITAQNLKDTAANLLVSGAVSDYVVAGTNVTIIDDAIDATIEQIKAIDEQNGDGRLTYSLQDDFDDILADLNDDSYDYLTGADAIQVTDSSNLGDRSIADIKKLLALDDAQSIKDMNGGDLTLADLTFNLKDTPANLAAAAVSDTLDNNILLHAGKVTASEEVTVSQAKTIYDQVTTKAVYDISDSASHLANGDSAVAIQQAFNVTATTTATATQATTISGLGGSGGELTYDVADTYANLTNGANSAGMNSARDVTVNSSGYLTKDQAEAVVAFNNSGLTTIPYIRDNAANINDFVSGNGEGENLRYDFYVEDSAANIITQIGDASPANLFFATGNAASEVEGDQSVAEIHVTNTFDVAGAKTFWDAINPVFDYNAETTAGKTYYVISDQLASFDNDVAVRDSVLNADRIVVKGTAIDIDAAQHGSDTEHRTIFDKLDGSDSLIVSDKDSDGNSVSDGNQLIQGSPGSDQISVGTGSDTVDGGAGNDTIYGGDDSDVDYLYGGRGRDTIHAGDDKNTTYSTADDYSANQITGGEGGDNMYGSTYFDTFYYAGSDRSSLANESGTTQPTRDYITNFDLGDRIVFSNVSSDNVQFFGSGSANASAVAAGTLALSIRYEENVKALDWNGSAVKDSTQILIDIADQNGRFDDQADMHIILVGSDIGVNWDGNSITFGA